ncbi:ABC transporter ATP-binding protein [Paenibacillus sp. FSL W7-1287]|uniref:ABC transporter ATP-binding protein n=1 Tax=Paenibacillus sp. FSL W7-1287 TaxID=2954538 RepID=UPI0030FC2D97
MRQIFQYLKPHWFAAMLAPILMAIEVAMDLLQPMLMASIIDNGILSGDQAHIVTTGLTMIGAAMIGLIGGVGCTIFASIASMRFGADLRNDVFSKVQTYSFRNMDKLETGSIITRLTNDIMQLQNVVQMLLRVLVRSPLLMIGSLVMAIYISIRLSIIVAIAVPLLFIVMYAIIKATLPLFSAVQHKLDRINIVLQESLSGIRAAKAFVRHEYEGQRFNKANDSFTEHSVKAQTIIALNAPLLSMILNVSIVAVLLLGGKDVIGNNFDIGLLVAYINYVTQLLFAISAVANHLVRLSAAKVSVDRVTELLSTSSEINDNGKQTQKIDGKVQFHQVSFRYDDNQPAYQLQDISFTVEAGQKLAIIGATGSGKSTLISLISRLYEKSGGEIYIDQHPVASYSIAALRSQIGFVLQESILFTGTIAQNIALAKPDADRAEIIAAAQAAEAHEFIQRLPQGYDTELGQRGVNLSGGQKQRIAIARALLIKPKILILDDSTSAIDMRTESRIQQHIAKLMADSTVIIVAQKISSIIDADQILLLDQGKIIAQGTHEELLKSSKDYLEIYRSQLGNEEVSYA